MACEPRIEAHEREGRERRSEQEEQRVLVGKAVPVDFDRVAENVPETVEVEGEIEKQRRSSYGPDRPPRTRTPPRKPTFTLRDAGAAAPAEAGGREPCSSKGAAIVRAVRLRAPAAGFAPARPASQRGASPAVLVVLLLLFALLAALVEAGALSRLDQFSLDHLMPALSPPPRGSGSVLTGLYRPFGPGTAWWVVILDLWTFPCSVLVSALVLATLLVVSRRRGGTLLALTLAGAWCAGNAVELLGKGVIRRPALYLTRGGVRIHIPAFDGSFPSGHMIRGAIVLAALALLVPRARSVLRFWYALVAPFLVLSSAHTPSDVLGGLLVGLVLVGGARLLAASPMPWLGRAGGTRLGDRALRRASVP